MGQKQCQREAGNVNLQSPHADLSFLVANSKSVVKAVTHFTGLYRETRPGAEELHKDSWPCGAALDKLSGVLALSLALRLCWLQELGQVTWLPLNQGQASLFCSPPRVP